MILGISKVLAAADYAVCHAAFTRPEIAKHKLGDNWLVDYVARANDGGIERVLV